MRTADATLNNGTITAAAQSLVEITEHIAAFSVAVKLVANGANGTAKLQVSNDNVLWFDVAGKTLASLNGTATALWEVPQCTTKYARVDFSWAADYTAEIKYHGKGV